MTDLYLPQYDNIPHGKLIVPVDWRSLDLGKVITPDEVSFLDASKERAGARIGVLTPMTVAERFEAFAWMGYKPHGLYLPYNERITADIKHRMREVGNIEDVDTRLTAYFALQDETEQMFLQNIEGRWTGQQAWARSNYRFRQVAVSRRGGKTLHAACEAIAMLKMRPRCRVWVASGTMHSASRCFDMILQRLKDLETRGMRILEKRNSRDEKYLVVEGGGIVEGVSLDDRAVEVGAAVDLAIIDEANEVSRDAWLHTVLPPLSDRNGKALMISSYRGQENFFYERTQAGASEDWELFEDTSWDVNFYAFPQGRQSPSIQAAERESSEDMASFLEEYGNIPTGTRRAIYPQYRDLVHAGEYPYEPGVPILLCIDPSSGANEYAVSAVQDFGDHAHIIDEYYRAGVLAEDAMAWVDNKNWAKDVREGVSDSAAPNEILRWRDHGYNIIAVQKPQVEERIPVYRKLLRDPLRFYPLFKYLCAEVLTEWGETTAYDDLMPKLQNLVYMEVEAKLSSTQLTPYLTDELKACSKIFINAATCPNTMQEHRTYAYRKPPRSQNAVPEKPRKWKDHLVDAIGYWAWMYKRFDVARNDALLSYSYLRVAGRPDIDELDEEKAEHERLIVDAADDIGAVVEPASMRSWLQVQRDMNRGSTIQLSSYSTLVTVRR